MSSYTKGRLPCTDHHTRGSKTCWARISEARRALRQGLPATARPKMSTDMLFAADIGLVRDKERKSGQDIPAQMILPTSKMAMAVKNMPRTGKIDKI